MAFSIQMTLNGDKRRVDLDDPRVTLLDLLRERLGLTGTKKGCDRGQCGACTVLVDGRRINACLTLAASLEGATVETIEGVADGAELPTRLPPPSTFEAARASSLAAGVLARGVRSAHGKP